MKTDRFVLGCILILSLAGCSSGGGSDPGTPQQTDINEIANTTGDGTGLNINSGINGGQNTANERPVYNTPLGVQVCSVDDVKRRVDFDMRDYYIFYDQVPRLNLDDYETPEALIADLRVAPDEFSYVTDAAQQSATVESGLTRGYGFWFRPAGDGVVRMRDIRAGSPADVAGILRGDAVESFNGIPMDDVTDEDISEGLGPENLPVFLTVRTGDEAPRDVVVEYGEYRWVTAGPALRYTNSNDALPAVGYLPIRRFLETTKDEIDASLAWLEMEGIEELIIDLRYNTGGRISVIRHLASVIGGAAVANNAFQISQWNDKYPERKSVDYFDSVENPLNLPRVIVLVTEHAGSSPEMFVNSLAPYIDVVVVGGVTTGSPYSSSAEEYCGKSINAMHSIRTNALGVAIEFGLQPDCPVEDDWATRANSVNDPLVNGALGFVTNSACPTFSAASPAPRRAQLAAKEYRAPEPFVPER